MIRTLFSGLVVAALIPAVAVAKDAAPEVLKRTGNWEVNYDRDACHLLAHFGDAKDPVIMRMTSYEPGDWFTLGLYGRRLASTETSSKLRVDFGLTAKPIENHTINGTTGPYKATWATMRLDDWERASPDEMPPRITAEQAAKVTGATIRFERRKPFRLEFGPMTKPLDQLRLCQTNLVKSWGYDPEVQTALRRPARPAGSPGDWLSYRDYPMDALRMGQGGIVQLRLDVNEEGKVGDCYVLDRTNPDAFADLTCRLVKRRAKLEPALDAQGKPVGSFFVQRFAWRVGT